MIFHLKFRQEKHRVYSKGIKRFQRRMTRYIYKGLKLANRWHTKDTSSQNLLQSKQDVAVKDSHPFDSHCMHFLWSIFWDNYVQETLVKVLSSNYCTSVEKSTFVVCNLLGFIVIQEVIRDLQFCISAPFIYKKKGWLVD